MGTTIMRARPTSGRVALAVLVLLMGTTAAGQNPYRLKQPDQQGLCLACHDDFAQKLKRRYVHTAVRSGECSGCHDPHVSAHQKLLAADVGASCGTCHESLVPAQAKSVHQVVANGQCQACHDPHASDTPANLVASGADLCVSCHQGVAETVTQAKFKHRPVQDGCVTCHTPHASETSERLLKAPMPGLCLGCHKPGLPAFKHAHVGYPVEKASCTVCHDAHGSDRAALLPSTIHAPLTTRACAQCHDAPDSATPFAVKRAGYELCKGCHDEMVTTTLAKPRLHWPVADAKGCVNCHSPHASSRSKLLVADTARLCASCHGETARAIAAVASKHEPVDGGTCTACHSPHAAAGARLFDQPTVNELCTACHDYSTHSAHPIGEQAVDPRNKNLRVDCLSCHRGHGTDHKHMLLAATNVELCTACHKQFGR
jgi:predicted CXXCH cytochrome family protein